LHLNTHKPTQTSKLSNKLKPQYLQTDSNSILTNQLKPQNFQTNSNLNTCKLTQTQYSQTDSNLKYSKVLHGDHLVDSSTQLMVQADCSYRRCKLYVDSSSSESNSTSGSFDQLPSAFRIHPELQVGGSNYSTISILHISTFTQVH